ncbi:MAG: CD1845 family protein [Oscillospiraceae bacterium]|nr:CD1845 family protein [Oscillospiraceae bacterium]
MKLILKLFAMPFALAFTVTAAFMNFVLSASAIFFSIASGLIFIGSMVLFISGEPVGGIAFLVVAFLVSPFGVHALVGKLVGLIDNAGGALRGFITS